MITLDLTADDDNELHVQSRYTYHNARCPVCGQRACLTQTTVYDSDPTMQANVVCPNAPEGHIKCTQTCCHGCQCAQYADCDRDGPMDTSGGQCQCDCHVGLLRLVTVEVIEIDPVVQCACGMCRPHYNTSVVPAPTIEYSAGYDGGEGLWISNRPRHCLHFPVNGRTPTISTYFDNSDGSNHRLDDFFGHPERQ